MTHDRIRRRPNFFIVGAPKCGTTAMDTYLKAHPDIFIPDYKEIHYFGSDLAFFRGPKTRLSRTRSSGRETEYLEYFDDAGRESALGESSVYYLFSTRAAREIFEFNPHAKIIIMLRNPLDALPSYHAQAVFQADEIHRSLEDALNAEDDRRAGQAIPSTTVGAFKLHYSRIYAYSTQIGRYLDTFPEDQLEVILYDDFAAAPDGTYRKILSLLGVDSGFLPEFKVINANKEARSRWLSTVIRRPPAWGYSVARLFPVQWTRAIRTGAMALNTRYRPRRAIDRSARQRLREMFETDIRRLERLINRDLSHWLED